MSETCSFRSTQTDFKASIGNFKQVFKAAIDDFDGSVNDQRHVEFAVDERRIWWASVAAWLDVSAATPGNSDLKLQQELLSWLKEILPAKAKAVIVADREFHSIRLAEWLEKELKLDYALRIKAGTYIEFDGEMLKTSELAVKGESFQMSDVKITKDVELDYRTNLTVHWAADEDEPWCLATRLGCGRKS